MKFRIGLVGAGRIATESHIPVWKSLEGVEIAAICDKRMPIAKEFASRFGIENVYDDLGDMLAKERLDVVDVCTPPFTHASLSIQAMEAGCHVLVEKPMATSVPEAQKMVDASKRCNTKLCVVHQNLCNSAVKKARSIAESGIIGEILSVDARTFESKNSEMCLNRNHWCHALPGGIFYEILPHPIYLLQSFLKSVTPVHVLSRKLGSIEWMAKDELKVLVDVNNGSGSIVVSCNSLMHGDTLDIIGTKMALRVDLWGRIVIIYKPHTQSPFSVGMSNLHLGMQMFKVIGSTALTLMKTFRGAVRVMAHYDFISKFVDSILENAEPPTTAEDGRETVKILELICRQLE